MSPRVQVVRFARVPEPLSTRDGGTVTAHLWLHDHAAPVGMIVRTARGWDYRCADGKPTGLTSDVSRQVLERQIVLYHLGALAVPTFKNVPNAAVKDGVAAAI
jgi:hypothetical protein